METAEPDLKEPLIYDHGKVRWSKAFQSSKAVELVKPLMRGVKSRPYDLGCYLYFVYGSRSHYKGWSRQERIDEVIAERAIDKEWLKKVIDDPAVITLVSYYQRLVLTPGEKLYFGLIEQIKRYREEAANIDAGATPEEAMKQIRIGRELLKSEKEIRQIMSEEGERKVWGGYEPSPFELPEDER